MTHIVATDYPDGRCYHWWAYFLAYCAPLDSTNYDIQYWLDHHNSKAKFNLYDSMIEFETEQDFTAFVLRWS